MEPSHAEMPLRPDPANPDAPTPAMPEPGRKGAPPRPAPAPPALASATAPPADMPDPALLPLARSEGGITLPAPEPAPRGLPTSLPDLVPRHILPGIGSPGVVTVTLAPAELGTLQFEVTQRGDSLHLHLSVAEPATLDLLRRQGDQMLAELRQAGFANASLSFAGNDGQPGPDARGGESRGGDPRGEGQRTAPPTAAAEPPETRGPAPPRAMAPGTLDLRL
ncbi:flagellar hook-length control protein FliK [Tabrizicola sp. TH137]|uniref:flagellar hook-length control protein FliK n=1 Tax=Tabrizicola sp. TH137 TaxID=2067452 RepID=UPI0013040939|nr:flagellar hook-length control protein FliK [Tabrizicola sp. TH137]